MKNPHIGNMLRNTDYFPLNMYIYRNLQHESFKMPHKRYNSVYVYYLFQQSNLTHVSPEVCLVQSTYLWQDMIINT